MSAAWLAGFPVAILREPHAPYLMLCEQGLLVGASCFSFSTTLSPTPRASAVVRTGVSATRMVAARRLDPMQLVQDKAMQTCALRPYKSKDQNRGLAVATFALG